MQVAQLYVDITVRMQKLQSGLNKAQAMVQKAGKTLQKDASKTTSNLQNMYGGTFPILAKSIKQSWAGLQKRVQGVFENLGGVVQRFTRYAALAFVAFSAFGVKAFGRFTEEVANFSTMLDAHVRPIVGHFADEIKNLSVEFAQTTQTLSRSMYDIISATIAPAKALDVLRIAAMGARGGLTTTKVAADALTTIMNAYGDAAGTATQISDKLYMAVKRGKMTFEGYADALGGVVGTASMAGMTIEEVNAAIATMTRSGLSAQEAVVSLNVMLRTFLKPTNEAIVAAEKYGLALNTETLQSEGLVGILRKLQGARADDIAQIFTRLRGMKGAIILTQKYEQVMKDLTYQYNAAGKTAEMYNVQAETTGFHMKQLYQSVQLLKIEWGKWITENVIGGTSALKAFTAQIEEWRKSLGGGVSESEKKIGKEAAAIDYATEKAIGLFAALEKLTKRQKLSDDEQEKANKIAKELVERWGDLNFIVTAGGDVAGVAADSFKRLNVALVKDEMKRTAANSKLLTEQMNKANKELAEAKDLVDTYSRLSEGIPRMAPNIWEAKAIEAQKEYDKALGKVLKTAGAIIVIERKKLQVQQRAEKYAKKRGIEFVGRARDELITREMMKDRVVDYEETRQAAAQVTANKAKRELEDIKNAAKTEEKLKREEHLKTQKLRVAGWTDTAAKKAFISKKMLEYDAEVQRKIDEKAEQEVATKQRNMIKVLRLVGRERDAKIREARIEAAFILEVTGDKVAAHKYFRDAVIEIDKDIADKQIKEQERVTKNLERQTEARANILERLILSVTRLTQGEHKARLLEIALTAAKERAVIDKTFKNRVEHEIAIRLLNAETAAKKKKLDEEEMGRSKTLAGWMSLGEEYMGMRGRQLERISAAGPMGGVAPQRKPKAPGFFERTADIVRGANEPSQSFLRRRRVADTTRRRKTRLEEKEDKKNASIRRRIESGSFGRWRGERGQKWLEENPMPGEGNDGQGPAVSPDAKAIVDAIKALRDATGVDFESLEKVLTGTSGLTGAP